MFRGVQVGRVSTISLDENQAQVTMLIEPSFKVPATATATIEPVNLFGAEQVSISTPHGNSDAGPYLAPGGILRPRREQRRAGRPLRGRHAAAEQDRHNNLATVLGELSQASQGEGPKIAASISAGTQLAGLLDRTLNAQILALDSFAKFAQATAPAAADFNNLNDEINAGLPAFNAEEADYEHLLNTLIPFSNRWPRCCPRTTPTSPPSSPPATTCPGCCWPSRTRSARSSTAPTTTSRRSPRAPSGLNQLPDGSTYAYFNTFILFSDVNSLVCNLIAPPTGGLSFLQPIQQALAGAGSAFNCSSELAAFNAIQATSPQSTPRRQPGASSTRLAHGRRPRGRQRGGQPGLRRHRPARYLAADQPRRHPQHAPRGVVRP